MDQRFFWYSVNRHKRKIHRESPIQDESGEIITDITGIRNEWNRYYRSLYTSPAPNSTNVEFMNHVNETIEQLDNSDRRVAHMEGGPITADETFKEVSQMRNRKASGWDLITAEHLKYSGKHFLSVITWLTNGIIEIERIPQHYKRGLIVPIPKGTKDQTIKDNNRGITLIPVLYKLLERLILNREKSWFSDRSVIDIVQGAGQAKCSSLHTSMMLQEVIAENRAKGATVYVAFLDIKKAFDTVWINGLLFKLHEAGLHNKTWQLIRDSYRNYECAAFIGGQPAPWFKPERGVHQGAPLSMPLYQIYVNDLLKQLRANPYAACVAGLKVGAPTFADDIAAATLYKLGLNQMLNIANVYSLKWQFEISIEKSLAMRWGRDLEPDYTIMMGNYELNTVTECKHMGIKLCSMEKNQKQIYHERIGKGKSVLLAAARGLGSASMAIPAKVLSKICWTVAIPSMTYGLEIVPVNDGGLADLEHEHRQNAKLIQGLPSNFHRPAALATLGWMSMASYVAMKKIIFLWSIFALPDDHIYKIIAISVLNKCALHWPNKIFALSPIADAYKYVCKYRLQDMMHSHNNEPFEFGIAKKTIRNVIWEHELQCWKGSQFLYPEMYMYFRMVTGIKMHTWWEICSKFPQLGERTSCAMALLMGGQPKRMQRNLNSSKCKLCFGLDRENANHVLFRCPALEATRNNTWSELIRCMPQAMVEQMESKLTMEKTAFMLSGLNGTYVPEWSEIYCNILNFVHKLYRQRAHLYDEISISAIVV